MNVEMYTNVNQKYDTTYWLRTEPPNLARSFEKFELPWIIWSNCIWSVLSLITKLNRLSGSLRFFCHIPLMRDQFDSEAIKISESLAPN